MIPSSFFSARYAFFTYAFIVLVLMVAYFESVPNQTAGDGVDDRIKAVYFSIRNFIFTEPEGEEWYGEYKKHTVYKKFKAKYPDSVDDFGFTINDTPMLDIEQHDTHGSSMTLTLFKCGDLMPFCYWVYCTPYEGTIDGGHPFEHAFDFIDSAECLQD